MQKNYRTFLGFGKDGKGETPKRRVERNPAMRNAGKQEIRLLDGAAEV